MPCLCFLINFVSFLSPLDTDELCSHLEGQQRGQNGIKSSHNYKDCVEPHDS